MRCSEVINRTRHITHSERFLVSPINHRATNNKPIKTKKTLDRVFG